MAPKFTIRTLFFVVTIAAVCSLMVRTSDWLAAMGFGLAALIVSAAAKLRMTIHNRRMCHALRCFLFLVASPIAWISIVDGSTWYEWCPNCSDHCFVDELRFCGIPVSSTHYPFHVDDRSRIRSDLGMPCDHVFEREHLVRKWGLLICAKPCIGITCCLASDPKYDDDVATRMQQYANDNPTEAHELYNRIVNEDDFDAMHAFIAKMKKPEQNWSDQMSFSAAEPSIEPKPTAQSH
jgi:hypothetical protein